MKKKFIKNKRDVPKVSILCATYNHEQFIEQALESFIKQKTNFYFEIIVYDDASTDKTAIKIKKYQNKYPNIVKPIFQKKNQYSRQTKGIVQKFLLPKAKGKYIAMCEGDDYWCDSQKLQISVDILDNNPDCVMFCHNTFVKKSDYNKMELLVDKNQKFENNKFTLVNSIYTHLSSRVFRNIKNLPPGDTFMYHYLLTKGYCYYYNKPMSVYRYNYKGVWSSLSKIQQDLENIKIYYLLNLFFKKKYNLYYYKMMPFDFGYYYNHFNQDVSWILYLISIRCNFHDVFNYKTKFIKKPIREIFLWKLIEYLDRKYSFTKLINENIKKNLIDKSELNKIITSFKLNKKIIRYLLF